MYDLERSDEFTLRVSLGSKLFQHCNLLQSTIKYLRPKLVGGVCAVLATVQQLSRRSNHESCSPRFRPSLCCINSSSGLDCAQISNGALHRYRKYRPAALRGPDACGGSALGYLGAMMSGATKPPQYSRSVMIRRAAERYSGLILVPRLRPASAIVAELGSNDLARAIFIFPGAD